MPRRLLVLFTVMLIAAALTLASARRAEALVTTGPDGQGVWPLQPQHEVVAGFDPPDSAYGAGHRGVDLAGHVGEVVHAALAGRVSFAGMLAGRGVVVVDHGSVRTTYEPVAATVHVGEQVARGASIGRLTLMLSHCFPSACLHWGLIRNADDAYLDPLTLVGAEPIRLLPLWRALPWSAAVGALW